MSKEGMVEKIKAMAPLTLSEVVQIANEEEISFVDVVLAEAEFRTSLSREEVLAAVMEEFSHNLYAIEKGLTTQESVLMGSAALDLNKVEGVKIFDDKLIDDAIFYTIAAQAGNHAVGLNPCAGTGDSCPYTGLIKAMQVNDYDKEIIAEVACIMLKVGSLFRVGKVSSGCNMEGFGAGSTAIAAAMTFLNGGSATDMERAMVMAISPTFAVPCTPRVMVPALCATHIGGAITNGTLAAKLAINTNIEVNVSIDAMIATASEIHKISAEHVVPVLNEFMAPYFKRKEKVENLVDEKIREEEHKTESKAITAAHDIAKKMAVKSSPITSTLGDAVVGGSSQAVGSPTNCGRILHEIAKGKPQKLIIELYPELFARRGINVPGILMGSLYGASTADADMYKHAVDKTNADGIEVEIDKAEEYQMQKVTLITDEGEFFVDSLNRGGGRLVIRDAYPSREQAIQAAEKLGIVVVEE